MHTKCTTPDPSRTISLSADWWCRQWAAVRIQRLPIRAPPHQWMAPAATFTKDTCQGHWSGDTSKPPTIRSVCLIPHEQFDSEVPEETKQKTTIMENNMATNVHQFRLSAHKKRAVTSTCGRKHLGIQWKKWMQSVIIGKEHVDHKIIQLTIERDSCVCRHRFLRSLNDLFLFWKVVEPLEGQSARFSSHFKK